MVSTGPGTYAHQRLPRVGRPHIARARFGPSEGPTRTILAVTETSDGKPCGTLQTSWRAIERSEVERARLLLPEYLLSEIPS